MFDSDFITAEEAKELSSKIKLQQIEEQRNYIHECIKEAVNRGENSVKIDQCVFYENTLFLKDKGFSVKDFIMGEQGIKISW